jgi:putative hemolysin
MSAEVIELLIVAVLIVANGVFSLSETAIVSARKARLQQAVEEGKPGAKIALTLANNPGTLLATVQVGITLIGTLSGAFGGARLSLPIASALKTIPPLAPHAESLALFLVVLGITYFSLIIGELVPKSLALNDPEGMAARLAPPMAVLSRIATPIVRFLNGSTSLILRLLRLPANENEVVTEEEIKVLVRQGERTGTFEPLESQIVERAIGLGAVQAWSVLTPRTDIIWIDLHDDESTVRDKIAKHGFSRYPLADGVLDNVIGMIVVKDVLRRQYRGEPFNLRATARTAIFIPQNKSLTEVIELFKTTQMHTALIIDEYGGIRGLVTLNDILAEMVGDAITHSADTDPQIVTRPDGALVLDGMLPIYKLKKLLSVRELPDEKHYETLGGLIMTQLGRIPITGDHVMINGQTFEVMEMDGLRVDRVLYTVPRKDTPNA